MKSIIILFLIGSVLTSSPILAEAPVKPEKRPINDLIHDYALLYNVNENTMHKVIKCESSYKENAVGDGGNSFGLAQIHLPSHPHITKAQATDSEYAINFLAKNLSQGRGKMWTCYRNLYT